MSADNYYIVRKHPDGGFAAVMGFASDEETPLARHGDVQFDTPEEALEAAMGDDAEYGHSIHPECQQPLRAKGGWVDGPANDCVGGHMIQEGEQIIYANGDVYRAERHGDGLRWVWVENVGGSEDYAFLLANVRDAVGDDE